jgi:hypothetical protein
VVKNEGEPGGGPFWVQDDKGDISLQIVESSQVNIDVAEQASIMAAASHFNPWISVRNPKFQREKFDLNSCCKTVALGYCSTVKYFGWNGATDWITLFVEVPLLTFNPVQ